MKNSLYLKSVLLLFITLFISSCERDDVPAKIQGEYLSDYKLISSYTQQQVKDKLILASFAFPDFEKLISSSDYGVSVYRILYNTSLLGENIIASGLVCIPQSEGTFPFASFQNGTNTCNSNAPSQNPSDQFYSLISVMAGSGYILTIPDYIGFGESEYILHPYHHKQSSNASVIDLVLAAKELVNSSVSEANNNNDIYLLGYSQGGWATLSVLRELELNSNYAFNTIAAACGAGAYNLMEMSRHVLALDVYSNPFYLPYFIESRRQNEILATPLSSFFKQPYADNIPELFDGNFCISEINKNFPQQIDSLFTSEFIASFESGLEYSALREELTSNSVDIWNLQANIHFFHSKGDNSVPYKLSQNMFNSFKEEGVPNSQLSLTLIDSLDHNEAIIPWGIDALIWLNQARKNN